ncbi:class I mannose-6-phosphate isomerase [Altererythrobacter aquiaggeris]|uniref:class I mannose-6-phosphate isomerase n=1 Tax=Aestuarierythrobacter aquiaggeris TaxID=1898396 RepID=UPI003018BD28
MSDSFALNTRTVEKVWGRDVLPAPFTAPADQRIGEIWFEPPEDFDQLLIKYLFTSQKLSVQVHPDDDQAQAAGLGRNGKEECWLVLAADVDAMLGIGFSKPLPADAMRRAALDGSIEQLLAWHPVSAGDFFHIPANTVHAIGPGVSLVEVQQNSDITYRLYDYGRPRELHLDAGIAVALGEPYPDQLRRAVGHAGSVNLVDGPHFRLDRIDGPVSSAIADEYPGRLLVLPLDGPVMVGDCTLEAGECAVTASIGDVHIPAGTRCLLTRPVIQDRGKSAPTTRARSAFE